MKVAIDEINYPCVKIEFVFCPPSLCVKCWAVEQGVKTPSEHLICACFAHGHATRNPCGNFFFVNEVCALRLSGRQPQLIHL